MVVILQEAFLAWRGSRMTASRDEIGELGGVRMEFLLKPEAGVESLSPREMGQNSTLN